jgi:hypothetical protein
MGVKDSLAVFKVPDFCSFCCTGLGGTFCAQIFQILTKVPQVDSLVLPLFEFFPLFLWSCRVNARRSELGGRVRAASGRVGT